MKLITKEAYVEATKNTRTRVSVASKLEAFLSKLLTTAKKSEAYEINVKDFCDVSEAHYYTAWKMINASFKDKLEARFILKDKARFETVYVTIK